MVKRIFLGRLFFVLHFFPLFSLAVTNVVYCFVLLMNLIFLVGHNGIYTVDKLA